MRTLEVWLLALLSMSAIGGAVGCGSTPARPRPTAEHHAQPEPPPRVAAPIYGRVAPTVGEDALELATDWIDEDSAISALLPRRATSVEEQWSVVDDVPQHCYFAHLPVANDDAVTALIDLFRRRGLRPERFDARGADVIGFLVETDRLVSNGAIRLGEMTFTICWGHPDLDAPSRLVDYQRAIPFLAPLNPLPEILGAAPESVRLSRVPDGPWTVTITYPITDAALDRAATWFLANGFQGDRASGWIARTSVEATADVTHASLRSGQALELLVVESAPK